jgi:GNAT superfamily N-acetyltransferase
MTNLREVDWAGLCAAFPDDMYLIHRVGDPGTIRRAVVSEHSWSTRTRSEYWESDWVMFWCESMDADERAAELAAHLSWHRGFSDGGDIGGMTLNDDTDLPDGLVMPAFNSWSWFWTDAVRAQVSSDADVVEIAHEDPRLKELLAHSPTAAHERDGKAPHMWFGIVEGDQLLSVAAVDKNGSSTLVQNVVTHADARGRGLATRVCSHATAWSLLEAPYATLGMMTDNEAAERIYLSLGYVCDKRFRSGLFG